MSSPEALVVWQKALRKLDDATQVNVQSSPGPVIVSSFGAMRNAAIAVLLVLGKTAPPAETAIIAAFGAAVAPDGSLHGAAFNRAFDLKTAEDYDPVDSPSVEDALGARRDAQALIAYCAARFDFPAPGIVDGTSP